MQTYKALHRYDGLVTLVFIKFDEEAQLHAVWKEIEDSKYCEPALAHFASAADNGRHQQIGRSLTDAHTDAPSDQASSIVSGSLCMMNSATC